MDQITQEAVECLKRQREKGLRKYGTDLSDANLTRLERLRHIQQEAADTLMYVTDEIVKLEADQ